MAIRVEFANGQEITISDEYSIENITRTLVKWVKFVPITTAPEAFTIYTRADHIVAVWEVKEEPLYKLEFVRVMR